MKIDGSLLSALFEQAEDVCPLECCGLLWSEGPDSVARHFTPYQDGLYRNGFAMDCEWLLRVGYQARGLGRHFKAYYHSHPEAGPALLPSARDLSGHPWGSKVLILGLAPRRCRLFHLFAGDGFQTLAYDPV